MALDAEPATDAMGSAAWSDIYGPSRELVAEVLGPLSAAGIKLTNGGALIAEELYEIPMMELGQILEVTIGGQKCPPIGMVLGNVVGKPEVREVYRLPELKEAERQGMSVVSADEVLSTMEVPCRKDAGCPIDGSDGVAVTSIEPSGEVAFAAAEPAATASASSAPEPVQTSGGELLMPGLLNTLPSVPSASSSGSASGAGSSAASDSGAASVDGAASAGGAGGEGGWSAGVEQAAWAASVGAGEGWQAAGSARGGPGGRSAPPPVSDESGELVAEWGDGASEEGEGEAAEAAAAGQYVGEEAPDGELELAGDGGDGGDMGPAGPAAPAWHPQDL